VPFSCKDVFHDAPLFRQIW